MNLLLKSVTMKSPKLVTVCFVISMTNESKAQIIVYYHTHHKPCLLFVVFTAVASQVDHMRLRPHATRGGGNRSRMDDGSKLLFSVLFQV